MDKLKLVKALVALLSFLLVFGILTAATLIYKKINAKNNPNQNTIQTIHLNEPFGSSINAMLENNGYIYLLVKDGGIADRIIVLDAEKLSKTAKIVLE